MITVPIDKYPYYEDQKMYDTEEIILKPGINSLVGCNGSGKTTFIDEMLQSELKKKQIDYHLYNDRRQGGTGLAEKRMLYDDISGFARMMTASEGERLVEGLADQLDKLRGFFHRNQGKNFVLIFDAIDSGMSVDEIIEIRDLFLDLVIPDAKQSFDCELYIVVAANNFEWCNSSKINNIDIITGKNLGEMTYDQYVKQIIDSREYKNTRSEGD